MTKETSQLLERISQSAEHSQPLHVYAIQHQLNKPGLPEEDRQALTDELARINKISNPPPLGSTAKEVN